MIADRRLSHVLLGKIKPNVKSLEMHYRLHASISTLNFKNIFLEETLAFKPIGRKKCNVMPKAGLSYTEFNKSKLKSLPNSNKVPGTWLEFAWTQETTSTTLREQRLGYV